MTRLTSKVTVKDRGWKDLRREMIIMAAKKAHVKVGVLSDGTHGDDGIGMTELAAIHEYGSPAAGIPERSFIRSTFHRRDPELREVTEKLVQKIFQRTMTIGRALGLLGAWGVSAVRNTITSRLTEGPEPQENKPATIARKGSSTPLVDHGLLKAAITWQVVGADAEAEPEGSGQEAEAGGEE